MKGKNAMSKNLRTTVLLFISLVSGVFVCAAPASADHTRIARRDYDAARDYLKRDYDAKREAAKYAYHRQRDVLLEARRQANRINCRDTRSLRVRAINRDLSALTRAYNLE